MKSQRPLSLWRLSRALEQSLSCLSADRVVLFGHLGLGDQISAALAIEAWAERVPCVLVPVKPRNRVTLSAMLSYLPNVEVVSMRNSEPKFEAREVRRIASERRACIAYAGREVFRWACRAYPEFGINRQLLVSALVQRESATSFRLREHLLALPQITQHLEEPYVFVDHHPGTDREIPRDIINGIQDQNRVVLNLRDVPLHELSLMMDRADELHLVSSAPLCLALTANLGRGMRFRYRVGENWPLKHDYPSDWGEIAVTAGQVRYVDRDMEAKSTLAMSRRSQKARELFSGAIAAAHL